MEWRALEEHFRVAATQEPGPFGDNAFEWDYSRYARGLGLTAEPGAHDLPHRGCAVVALPATRWDAAEAKYRAWAERLGWAVWRFGARPTVAVPDPVVYALGVRAAGPDAFLLARATPPVVPTMGKRARSEAMSFPLTAGERWLIATDRVRRRMRAEVAMRGLVLFIDEAEWLAPAGMAVLMYLLDAHRAWRARMLSRPARVYIVLATTPEREGSMMRMLERFDLTGHTPVARERRKDEKGASGFVPPALRDIEEEYLYSALAAAPAALAEEDVRSVFGASAIDRCRAMAERGLLRVRTEAGQACYVPSPVPPSGLAAPAPAPRALRAIAARYRDRARRGHEHLALARAALSLDLGDPLRAVAAVARMPYTAGAVLPLRLFEALDATLERARPRLRADHAAAWFSLAAHHRAYDHARDLANAVTDHELRTWKEMLRVVQVLLCAGRTHLDTCLPPDFWPRLKSQNLSGPFMDATCVLGELFWRKRYLGDDEIRQRYEFACGCFARWDRPQSVWLERLERLAHMITYRAALQLEVPSTILSSGGGVGAATERNTLRTFLRRYQIPAYVSAAPMFAEAGGRGGGPPRSFDRRDWVVAATLAATTGQLEDLAVVTATTIRCIVTIRLRLLMRDLLDDLLLFLLRRSNPSDRHELGRFLHSTTGGRVRLMGATAFSLEHGRTDAPGRDASDEITVTEALVHAGDLAGARDRLMAGFAHNPRCPYMLSILILTYMTVSRKTLDRTLLASTERLIDQYSAVLTAELRNYLGAFLDGSQSLLSGDSIAAQRHFSESNAALHGTFLWTEHLRRESIRSRQRAECVSNVTRAWSGGAGCSVWRALRAMCDESNYGTSSKPLSARASVCLDYVLGALNAWACKERAGDDLLRIAVFLREDVDAVFRPLGGDFLGLLAEWAPNVYEQLRRAVVERVGAVDVSTCETRALHAALRTIEDAWKASHAMAVDDGWKGIVVNSRWSTGRQARAVARTWYDDATTYAQLWDGSGRIRVGDGEMMAYGYVGRVRAKAVPTLLRMKISDRGEAVRMVDVVAGGSPQAVMCTRQTASGVDARGAAFLGNSVTGRRVRGMIESAAKCGYPVLVLGETGVGKDLVARCIHVASALRGSTMVVADCAGLAESLLESELFGHEKGAFTGAHASHGGFFERAHGSSLLLDEVDSMSARMQATLLRVLETGEYRPVGASFSRKSEFRLISAALPRLVTMVEGGEFRKDLFYRMSTLRIEIPPLRDRDGDSREIAVAHARSMGFLLTAGALRAVAKYAWPGNVRQLRHCIQAAGLHASDRRIGEAAISEVISTYGGASANGKADDGRGLDAAWGRALGTLERMGRFGAWDFAKAAELSRRSAQRHLAQLLRDGRISRVGAGRTTRYSVRS